MAIVLFGVKRVWRGKKAGRGGFGYVKMNMIGYDYLLIDEHPLLHEAQREIQSRDLVMGRHIYEFLKPFRLTTLCSVVTVDGDIIVAKVARPVNSALVASS